ncbi:MAG TPA: hypothetical protein V6C52_06320 [Coleofasciculaceae cyanobacterium]|jgi:hypothetical protein
MNFPEHYRVAFRTYLRFIVIMLIVALLLGIMFQESAKKTPFSAALPAGVHIETMINLALVHGHTFLIGALIPLGVTWMLYLGLMLGHPPIGEKPLGIGTRLYLPAAVGAIILMLYKGYHFQLGVRAGEMDFRALDQSYFFGSHALRAAAYGITHTALAVGLGMILVSFWKTLKKQAS